MTPCQTPFRPLIQPKDTLSGAQKYLLRLLYGWAGRTILHRGRLVEVLETRESLRRVLPLVEPDLSESLTPSSEHNPSVHWTRPKHDIQEDGNGLACWIPRRGGDRKRFNIERRNNNRKRITIGISWPGERLAVETVPLERVFPSEYDYVKLKWFCLECDEPSLYPQLSHPSYRYQRPSRAKQRPLKVPDDLKPVVGGDSNSQGFTLTVVAAAIAAHRWQDSISNGVFEVVYDEKKLRAVAAERGLPSKKLSEYVWRVRKDLRSLASAASNIADNRFVFIGSVDKTP
jgi:hypothetical protein